MKTRLYDLTLLAIVTIRSRSVLLPDFLPTRSQAERKSACASSSPHDIAWGEDSDGPPLFPRIHIL